jgi:hypothetical protein
MATTSNAATRPLRLAKLPNLFLRGALAYFARLGLAFPPDALRATAARMSALNTPASTSSPSWMSIARLTFPSRFELKSLAGSFNEAPLAKVNFTIDL